MGGGKPGKYLFCKESHCQSDDDGGDRSQNPLMMMMMHMVVMDVILIIMPKWRRVTGDWWVGEELAESQRFCLELALQQERWVMEEK